MSMVADEVKVHFLAFCRGLINREELERRVGNELVNRYLEQAQNLYNVKGADGVRSLEISALGGHIQIKLAVAVEKLQDMKVNHPTNPFEVEFIKRSDGQYRKMKCQGQDPTYVKGGAAKYKPEDKNLISVYDLEKNRYGSVALEGVCKLVIDDVVYVVEENEKLIPQ